MIRFHLIIILLGGPFSRTKHVRGDPPSILTRVVYTYSEAVNTKLKGMKSELHLLFFATSVASMRVFVFNSTGDGEEAESTAILSKSPEQPLPENFTVCFAMKQDKIDGRSPLLIRDRNNQPWIAISIWDHSGVLGLWGEVGKRDWKMFQVFERPWKFWSHICAGIDTGSGMMSVSVDGRPSVSKHFERLKEGSRPLRLENKLDIGVTETEIAYGGKRPFLGEVSNIQFHFFDESKPPELLSKDPCLTNGTYLAWSDMTFEGTGNNAVYEIEREELEVCDVLPDFYNALLPGHITWLKADYLCKVLGGGSMTGVEDEKDIERLASWVGSVGSCPVVWLPLSDERKEGFWENTNSNSEAKFLRWSSEQPNGFRTQNHAGLSLEHFHFGDFHAKATHCASCTLSTAAILTMRGVCKDSFLGETKCYPKKEIHN